MAESFIHRYSSRTTDLRETVLREHLARAVRYHRIAGYFTSSLFELAGEDLAGIADVRIVCNSDVTAEDLVVARSNRVSRPGEAALLGRLHSHAGMDALLHRERYQRLHAFLEAHPDGIRVAPDELCGFVHGKAGVVERDDGGRLAFIGSMNETRAGWKSHYELLWSDTSDEGVDWVQSEFDWLWARSVPLPQVVLKEIKRRTHRVEVDLNDINEPQDVAPAALVESPLYREGFSLSPWQRAFVAEAMKHLAWFGAVRLLVADEVGLGKTLSLATAMLALTLKGEQERETNGSSRRPKPVVIFAPATLTPQWQTELLDKLGLPTARWDNRNKAWVDPQENAISPRGADQIARCPLRVGIISTGLITQPTLERDHLSQMSFETLVLDESHKARERRGIGNQANEKNRLLAFMLSAAGRSRHVLLGTATPMQTEVDDLWDQLQILHSGAGRFVLGHDFSPWHTPEQTKPLLTGEDACRDLERAWKHLKSPLPPMDSSQEPGFRRVISALRQELGVPEAAYETNGTLADLPDDVREDLEDLVQSNVQGATFFQRHNPIVRHVVLRKRSILEDQGLLDRVDVTLHPDINAARSPAGYHRLFEGNALRTSDAFDEAYTAAGEFGKAYGKRVKGAGFMTNLLRQRICSSAYAAYNTATQILRGQSVADELSDQEGEPTEEITPQEREALERLIGAVDSIQGQDPKIQAVRHYLVDERWVEHGVIVFSQYYDTAHWVAEEIARMFPTEPIGIYAGAGKSRLLRGEEANAAEREDLKAQVQERQLRIMVATDAACEGLNLQKLGTLINIDLPWNPVKLEQRIGRIKRFGQTRPAVDMLNLVYQGTVDETIYDRLSERMQERFEVFGSLPDTIDDEWIEDAERLAEELDKRINAQREVNGFDLRYNQTLAVDDDAWRDCARVLSQQQVGALMRQGWR